MGRIERRREEEELEEEESYRLEARWESEAITSDCEALR